MMGEKYICLRDDDTNYFTSPEKLKGCYEELWGKIPITLATIPFVHGSERQILYVPDQSHKYASLREWEISASVDELSAYHTIYPVGLNKELVCELKKRVNEGTVEIAQHGVNHRYTEYGEEMRSSNLGFSAIRDGKEYLEKVFEKQIKVFIPPANTIDNICADHVNALGMHLFCCGSMIYTSQLVKYEKAISNPRSSIDSLISRLCKECKPIRNRGGYIITGSITYDAEKKEDDVLNRVNQSLHKYGFASITTHYRLLCDDSEKGKKYNYKEHFHHVINKLLEDKEVRFVSASEYIQRAGDAYL